jgi:hypothetical protein
VYAGSPGDALGVDQVRSWSTVDTRRRRRIVADDEHLAVVRLGARQMLDAGHGVADGHLKQSPTCSPPGLARSRSAQDEAHRREAAVTRTMTMIARTLLDMAAVSAPAARRRRPPRRC